MKEEKEEKEEKVLWAFCAYQTLADGREVQEWFDGLSEEEKDEIKDSVGYLQVLPLKIWAKPRYFPLGEGLSEIRVKANRLNKIYRIYGCFWPPGRRHSYAFLLGRDKKVKNPRKDIALARKRQGEVERGEVQVHEFKFENKPH